MFRFLRALRRLLALALLILVATMSATAIYCYRHRDQIIQKFIEEANKKLPVPVQVRNVQLTTLKSFPRIALVLQDVTFKNFTQDTNCVAVSEFCCAFDLWKLLQGQYTLEYVALERGQIDLSILLGCPIQAQASTKHTSLVIDLQKLVLRDIDIVYGQPDKGHSVFAHQLQVYLKNTDKQLQADLRGKLTPKALPWAPQLALQTTVRYDAQPQTITLQTAKLQHGDAQVTAQGSWPLQKAQTPGKIRLKGQNITPQTLGHYLPEQLQGHLSFDAHLHQAKPFTLQGSFSVQDGTWTTQHLAQPIQLQTVHGTLHLPNLLDLRTGRLRIDKLTGSLGDQQLVGSFALDDFAQKHLRGTVKGQLDLAAIAPLLVRTAVQEMAGQLTLDCALKTTLGAQQPGEALQLTGTLQLQEGQGRLTDTQLLWKDVAGKVTLQDQAWVLHALTGSWGPSTFALSGTVQPDALAVQAKLYTDYLDLDALLGDDNEKSAWRPIIPCKAFTLDCDIQQLHYRRFQGKNVQGRLCLRGTKLIAEKLQWGMAGGKVSLQGAIAAKANGWDVHTTAQLQKVDLGKFFYICENFHQDFLTDQHLQGQIFADCDLKWQLDRHGNVDWKGLQADMDVQLRQGVLHHFPPLQQLARYVPQENLAEVHFPALKNHLKIRQGTIYIPSMEVYSSIKRMQLSGTHTLDGKIDYRLVAPLSGDGLEGINLFLKLQGDVNDYKVTFDAQALKESFQDNLQTQGRVLQQILEGTYQRKAKVQELTPDDYFDFD